MGFIDDAKTFIDEHDDVEEKTGAGDTGR